MASRNYHKRRTQERKDRQRAGRCLERLREQAVQFEHMTPAAVLRMSQEALERVVRTGKQRRRRMVTPMDGIALAIGAAAMLSRSRR